jgi:protein phosphatase
LEGCLARAAARPEPGQLARLFSVASRAEAPQLATGAATTIGCNPDRHRNEDSFGLATQWVGGAAGSRCLTRAAVSDGMGGMDAGDEASRAAIEVFLSAGAPADIEGNALAEWAVALGWAANGKVIDQLRDRHGGATFTGVVLDGARFALVHVGDSRAYLWQHDHRGQDGTPRDTQGAKDTGADANRLVQLTQDHTLVAAKLASGVMSPEEAAESTDRNQLLRSLGSTRGTRPGFFAEFASETGNRTQTLSVGAVLVLVSDGVWDVVAGDFTAQTLARNGRDPQLVAQALVDEAVRGGAPDNATAVVIRRVR